MAIKKKSASSASKGSTARGTTRNEKSKKTKNKNVKTNSSKATKKKVSSGTGVSPKKSVVKASKVKPEKVENNETEISVTLRADSKTTVKPVVDLNKELVTRTIAPNSNEVVPQVAIDSRASIDESNSLGLLRSPLKDVDVMLLGGKVIDLRPSEPLAKPKNRKKLQTLQWSPARRKYVAEYLADAQIALRLSDWEITLQFGVSSDPDGDTLATMTAYEDQRRATMRFGKDFFDLSSAEMRQTLIHEMLHCHMFAPHHNAERTVTELGGTRAGSAFSVGMTSMIELATDAIADALAPFFPTFELPER